MVPDQFFVEREIMKIWIYFLALSSIFRTEAAEMQSAHRYHEQTRAWCSKVIQADPTDEEKTLLANLLYWSWQRSATILSLQQAVVEYVQHSGTIIDETMGARLNPAKISSILKYETREWERDYAAFEKADTRMKQELKRYRFVAATYAQCIEYLIKTGDVRSAIKDLVQELREQSRAARLVVMQEQCTSLTAIMDNLKKVMHNFGNHVRDYAEEGSRSLFDCVVQFVTPAVFNSFATFDKKYNLFNKQFWNVLVNSYAMNNLLWEVTEQVRVDFYKAHYEALLQLLGHEERLMIAAFDADGFVEINKREQTI